MNLLDFEVKVKEKGHSETSKAKCHSYILKVTRSRQFFMTLTFQYNTDHLIFNSSFPYDYSVVIFCPA